MKIELELDDRQYGDIERYCQANNLNIQEYVVEIISNGHSINKFGDLNDTITKTVEESVVSAKKRTTSNKITEEPKEEREVISTNKAVVKKKRTLNSI
jgi:hypothetical protein